MNTWSASVLLRTYRFANLLLDEIRSSTDISDYMGPALLSAFNKLAFQARAIHLAVSHYLIPGALLYLLNTLAK
jgi:hypothetical protein